MKRPTIAELEQHIEALKSLSSTARHDLNNMLFVISGYAYLLKSQTEDPNTIEQLDEIENSIQQSKQIMADWKTKEADIPGQAPAQ